MIRAAQLEGKFARIKPTMIIQAKIRAKIYFTETHTKAGPDAANQEFLRVIVPLPSMGMNNLFQSESNYLQVIQPLPEQLDSQVKVFYYCLR